MSCRCYRCDLGQEVVQVETIKCFESDSEVGIAKYTSSAQDAKSDPNVTECLNGPTSDHEACECHPQVLPHQILLSVGTITGSNAIWFLVVNPELRHHPGEERVSGWSMRLLHVRHQLQA